MPLTSQDLIELLPELQKLFNVIIIDAPPIDCADTHLFAKLARQVLLLVKKRRDSFKLLQMAQALDQELKLNMKSLLLT
jgi:cellulose biosynthesis protein BcsQ